MLKFITYNDRKRRNHGQIQEPCRISDEALCNSLPLPIVAKSSTLNVADFLGPSLKVSPWTKTSPVSCENESFFLLFRNIAAFIESHCFSVTFYSTMKYFGEACYTTATTILFSWIQSVVIQSQNYL